MRRQIAFVLGLVAALLVGVSLRKPAPTPPTPAAQTPAPAGPVSAPAATIGPMTEPGLRFREATAGGRTIRYAVYLPPGLDRSSPIPAVVFLHGRMESGTDGVRQLAVGLFPAVLDRPERWPAVIIACQKPTREELWHDSHLAVIAALDATAQEVAIDPSRVYLTGLSQGGAGTWAVAAEHPERFAAIAPICGFGDPAFLAPRVGRLPIWTFHGVKDTIITPDKTTAIVDAIRSARASDPAGPEPILTLLPDAEHNAWDPAYRGEDLPAWLFAQRRR